MIGTSFVKRGVKGAKRALAWAYSWLIMGSEFEGRKEKNGEQVKKSGYSKLARR